MISLYNPNTVRLFTDRRMAGVVRYHAAKNADELMLIPPDVEKSVVFLGVRKSTSPDTTSWVGTGFFVAIEVPELETRISYLVTAQHCINGIRHKSSDGKLYVRTNRKSSPSAMVIETQIDDWRCPIHADVAILLATRLLSDVDYGAISERSLLSRELAKKIRLLPGEDVFLSGLYVNVYGNDRNMPIMRIGNLAAMPRDRLRFTLDKEVPNNSAMSDAYLIESRSLGGLSGSPVFVHRGAGYRFTESQWELVSTGRDAIPANDITTLSGAIDIPPGEDEAVIVGNFWLLGLVHGHWELKEPLADLEDMDSELTKSVNAGIAKVVPAHIIVQALYNPDVVTERNEIIQSIQREPAL